VLGGPTFLTGREHDSDAENDDGRVVISECLARFILPVTAQLDSLSLI
jgi:hypothetical protein